MAIRLFNSVGGYSVGETPITVIYANADITTGNVTASANVSAGNLLTNNLLYANGVPWNFLQAGGSNTQIQFNNNQSLGGSSNFTFNTASNTLTVLGTANVTTLITTGNANVNGNLGVTGNVTAPYFYGNVVGNISGNIVIPGNNTDVIFNDQGSANSSDNFTFNKATNTLTVNGNIVAGNISGANLISANYHAGTLTTAAQPNITSVGTLTSLNVSGTANVGNLTTPGNLTVTGVVISNLVPAVDATYNLGNSTLHWNNAYVSGNIFLGTSTAYLRATGATIYMDSVYTTNNGSFGTLTSRGDATMSANLVVNGNLTVNGTTTYVDSTVTAIADPIIDLGGSNVTPGANVSGADGYDRGLFLHNWDSLNHVPLNQFIGWKTANSEFQVLNSVVDSANVVTGSLANIRANVLFGNLTGTILTASQTGITTLGTLTNLTIAGNLQVNTNANINSLKAGGLQYPSGDGSSGQMLATYGNGTLYFTTVSTSSITNGTSNVTVLNNGNVLVSSSGTANVLTVTSTGANIAGTLNATGNVILQNPISGGGTTLVDTLNVTAFYAGNSAASATSTAIRSSTTVTNSTASSQILAKVSTTGVRAVEYFVKGEDTTGGKYSVATVSAVHNGVSVDYTVYGAIAYNNQATGSGLSVSLSGGILYLTITPASSNPTTWTTQYRTI